MNEPSLLERHQAFWNCKDRGPALFGVIVGGWSAFRENSGAKTVWGEGYLAAEMLRPDAFVKDCEKRLEASAGLGDDIFHTAQPFPAVPWLEAMAGCSIRRSSDHLWTEPVPGVLDRIHEIRWDPRNPWVEKYMEFLSVFAARLPAEYPVAQSIVRGPLDVASALLGDTDMIFALHDRPGRMDTLLSRLTDLAIAFLREQEKHMPQFRGGSVVGQYEIWAPGWALRLQEDAVALLSPRHYGEFMAALHARLCALTPYNMFHLHTTSLHVLDDLLKVGGLGAVEISRDEGVEEMADLIDAFKRVQQAGHPLVVKGRFAEDAISRLLRELTPNGLCIQVVVDTRAEAERMMRFLRAGRL